LTAPVIPAVPVFPPPPPPPAAVGFPLRWLLEHASAPIQYRATIDVARHGDRVPAAFHLLPYGFRPAVELAVMQAVDGVWNDAMLTLPPRGSDGFQGVGTVHAVRRMLEYGWDKDSPPVYQARRMLFRLLAEDDDPSLLFELAPKAGAKGPAEEEVIRMTRQILREAAGAALAQSGFETDPRLRGAARRTLDRMMEFLKSPVGEKPWIRIGNRQVLSPDAFPPSIYALQMLSHMPLFRSEHYEGMELLYRWLNRPLPRQDQMQVVGKKILPVPLFVMGDRLPHRNAVEADVPAALSWLELMARMGFLRRNDNWTKMFERFVDDMDRSGVWHPRKGMAMPRSSNPFVWPMYPLEDMTSGDERWADVTMRIGIIARAAGRTIELL
jgi:hypothetical protein